MRFLNVVFFIVNDDNSLLMITTVWCAVSLMLKKKGGVYCEDCNIAELVPDDSQSLSSVRSWAIDEGNAK